MVCSAATLRSRARDDRTHRHQRSARRVHRANDLDDIGALVHSAGVVVNPPADAERQHPLAVAATEARHKIPFTLDSRLSPKNAVSCCAALMASRR
jgi:hypothetical protein